jgi:hypothetical protein
MIEPGEYLVIDTNDAVHLPQGFGVPNVGDIVVVANRSDTRWSNRFGNWCWAEKKTDGGPGKYGANFLASMLMRVDE